MVLIKTTINRSAFLALAFWVQNLFGQTSNFQQSIHRDLVHFGAIRPKGNEWEARKKVLANYSQEEVARALLVEVGLDYDMSGVLNSSVRELYRALDLPPAFVCQELERTDSPGRKAALMRLLEGHKQPEVTAELLKQIKDRRVAYVVEHAPDLEGPGNSMRVCDVACNVLSYNLEPGGSNKRVFVSNSETKKDQLTRETLTKLHLNEP